MDPGGPLDFSPIHPPISAIHRVASASVGISGSTGFCRFFRSRRSILRASISIGPSSTLAGRSGCVRDALDLALEGVNRAVYALQELLVVPGRARGEPCAVALAPALAALQRLMRRVLPATVLVTIDPVEERLAVLIDPGALEQVLINLALNARDAMPDGGTLRLTATLDPAASDRVTLIVADDGVGMPPEVISRIFEARFSTKPRERGTGLGLASVVAIISGSGGTIRCESAIGVGTRFIITLPQAGLPPESARRS